MNGRAALTALIALSFLPILFVGCEGSHVPAGKNVAAQEAKAQAGPAAEVTLRVEGMT